MIVDTARIRGWKGILQTCYTFLLLIYLFTPLLIYSFVYLFIPDCVYAEIRCSSDVASTVCGKLQQNESNESEDPRKKWIHR